MIKNKLLHNLKYTIIGLTIGISMMNINAIASQVNQLLVSKVDYPIVLNGTKLDTLLALNHEGKTFLQLRQIAEVTGTQIKWNDSLRQVEIGKILDVKPTPTPTYDDNYIRLQYIVDNYNCHIDYMTKPLSEGGTIYMLYNNRQEYLDGKEPLFKFSVVEANIKTINGRVSITKEYFEKYLLPFITKK